MKRAIVIGGGFAGATAAKLLEGAFETTLIDTKNYFEFTPGILRTVVDPTHLRKVQALHSHYLHRATIVTDTVVAVDTKTVRTANASYPYDYLVIASGSNYNPPIKESCIVIATRAEHLREHHERLSRANSVLIIGGGLVGVELAAEIVGRYSNKKVTIVHAGDKLIERTGEKAIRHATSFLRKKGVEIKYNERVVGAGPNGLTTSVGNTLRADMTFMCTGIVPNFEFMRAHLPEKLNPQHLIKVNDFLQVEGQTNIFAVGDVNDRLIEKTAQNSQRQARMAVANILAVEAGKPLNAYTTKPTPMVISLGKWNGIFVHSHFTLTGLIPGLLKSFIERKEMVRYR